MSIPFIADTDSLRQLVSEAAAQMPAASRAVPCSCAVLQAHLGWTSITEDRWPASVHRLATLRDPDLHEPTFEEHHLGTRYESPEAPVAIKHFPYNRAEVWQCACHRLFLRYTEFGGYYVDHRVRVLQASRIVDVPAP